MERVVHRTKAFSPSGPLACNFGGRLPKAQSDAAGLCLDLAGA
ncbi:hypothetical protein [Streptomyces inhibens]|nr:hypothetical protein [Streptomyces inhibens]